MVKECGKHSFSNITKTMIDKIFNALRANGAIVVGANPWKVDTNKHGVMLYGIWDQEKMILLISVLDKDFFVPCDKIWEVIVPTVLNIRDSEKPPIV